MKIKEIKDKEKLSKLFESWCKWQDLLGSPGNRTLSFFLACWGNSDERKFSRIRNEAMNSSFNKSYYFMRTGKKFAG